MVVQQHRLGAFVHGHTRIVFIKLVIDRLIREDGLLGAAFDHAAAVPAVGDQEPADARARREGVAPLLAAGLGRVVVAQLHAVAGAEPTAGVGVRGVRKREDHPGFDVVDTSRRVGGVVEVVPDRVLVARALVHEGHPDFTGLIHDEVAGGPSSDVVFQYRLVGQRRAFGQAGVDGLQGLRTDGEVAHQVGWHAAVAAGVVRPEVLQDRSAGQGFGREQSRPRARCNRKRVDGLVVQAQSGAAVLDRNFDQFADHADLSNFEVKFSQIGGHADVLPVAAARVGQASSDLFIANILVTDLEPLVGFALVDADRCEFGGASGGGDVDLERHGLGGGVVEFFAVEVGWVGGGCALASDQADPDEAAGDEFVHRLLVCLRPVACCVP